MSVSRVPQIAQLAGFPESPGTTVQAGDSSGRDICTTTPFLDFGLGSLDAIEIVADLERHLSRPLSPTVVYNHPNVADLATWLASTPVPAPANTQTPHQTPREAELARNTASSARRTRAPKPR